MDNFFNCHIVLMLCSVIISQDSQRKAAYQKWIRQIFRQSGSKEPTIIHGIQVQVRCVVVSITMKFHFRKLFRNQCSLTRCVQNKTWPQKSESPTWPNTRNYKANGDHLDLFEFEGYIFSHKNYTFKTINTVRNVIKLAQKNEY